LKYYFPARTCAGGSPRFQLAIDTDGDSSSNGNAFGYVGHVGFGGGCITGAWDFVDLTDAVPSRWDLTQFGLGLHSGKRRSRRLPPRFPITASRAAHSSTIRQASHPARSDRPITT
jgi:hypothetical protein